jgi:hypothetical protein
MLKVAGSHHELWYSLWYSKQTQNKTMIISLADGGFMFLILLYK